MTLYHLDYESRSCCDLQTRGLHNYATDPTTSILCAAFAEGDNKVRVWQPHLEPKMPAELREVIEDPFVQVAAWNSPFERSITKFVQKMDKPTSEWVDPSIQARYLSMPGSLEDAGKILGLKEDEAKLRDGKRLLKMFSEPQTLGGVQTLFGVSKPTFRDWSTDPQDWQLLLDYCVRDVEAERTIMKKMARFPVPELERQGWELNEKVNAAGMPVDLPLIRGAQDIADRELEKLRGQLKELTNLDNCNSNDQILGWLKNEGYTFGGLGKAFVERAMNGECQLTDRARKALEIRKMTSKSSVRKFTAIARNVSADGRLRNQFVFYGAARTGRFSGRDAQLQNLPRPTKEVEKNMDRAIELVQKMDYAAIIAEFTQPLDVITSTIRSSFRAPEGNNLVVVDLASIESRVAGAAARCEPMLDIFRQGLDPYITFAARMFNKPYEEVTKEERTKAKAPVLGCSYGLGGGEEQTTEDGDIVRSGLWGYAAAMNIELTQEESAKAVDVFRKMYPEVPVLWKDLQEAAISAVRNPGQEFPVGVVSFRATGKTLLSLNLPSGRSLSYMHPLVEMREHDGKFGPYKRAQLSYEGREQGTRAWSRIATGGPKICENLVQAIARDILINGMIEADRVGMSVVGHVHDEIIALVPVGSPLGVDTLRRCMTSKPAWMNFDMPLDASGYLGTYYRK